MKDAKNLMQRAHAAPRCSARAKSTGKPCNAPAVKVGVYAACMEPAVDTGLAVFILPGAIYVKQWIEIRAAINSLIRTVRSC